MSARPALAVKAACRVALIMGLAASLHAQEQVSGQRPSLADFLAQTTADEEGASPILPPVWCSEIDHDETWAQCWQSYRASLRYYETGLAHRAQVFAWQHFSTRVIFVVVLGIVMTGLFFAWIQFRQGLAWKAREDGAPEAAAGHELQISMEGLKVSSPVLGVVILALSLAFFYLYLVYVYPITEIF